MQVQVVSWRIRGNYPGVGVNDYEEAHASVLSLLSRSRSIHVSKYHITNTYYR